MADLEDVSDWEAMRRFKALESDGARLEQMFMTSLAASRSSRQNGRDIAAVDRKVDAMDVRINGRIVKVETESAGNKTKWIQVAAVIAFLLVMLPLLLAAVALFIR